MKRIIPIILFLTMLVSAAAFAAIPKYLSYQGVLTDAGGAVVPDGTYSLTFKLYDVGTGGTALWTETDNVQVSKGIFNATLGTLVNIGLPFDKGYYLGISVEGGTELAPRVLLKPGAYSYSAMNIWGDANIFPSVGYVGIGTKAPTNDLHIFRDANSQIGLKIENPNTGTNSAERISFTNEDGDVAGIACFDHDNGVYPGAMRIFNNRPDGSIELKSAGGSMFLSKYGRLGIGTSAPSQRLDVLGTVKMTGFNMSVGAHDGYVLTSDASGNGTWSPPASVGSDGDWTISGNNMYSAVSGNVGVGDNTPTAKLDVLGGQWDLDNTDGDVKIGDDTYKLKMGIATGGGGAGTAGIRVQGGVEKLILGAGSKEAMTIDSLGAVNIGTESMSGTLYHYLVNHARGLYMYDYLGDGSAIDMYDEEGNYTIRLQPDYNGTGGFFGVYRNSSSPGFSVDGNYLNSGNPAVQINGGSRSATFNMNASGNLSVVLPDDAISAYEILDEPGGASSLAADITYIGLATSTYTTLTSRTITVPSAGYVYVIATSQVNLTHTTGTYSRGVFGVSQTNTAFEPSTDIDLYFSSSSPSATYRIPLTSQALFPVAASGSYTYYFLGYEYSGSYSVGDVRFTLIFIPTAYGTVASPAPPASTNEDSKLSVPGLTNADIEAERAESISFNMERIQRELDAMRKQMKEMQNNQGNGK